MSNLILIVIITSDEHCLSWSIKLSECLFCSRTSAKGFCFQEREIMATFFCVFNITLIITSFIQAISSDNLSPIVSSFSSGLPLASVMHAKAIRDEGFATHMMAQSMPKLAFLPGIIEHWCVSIASSDMLIPIIVMICIFIRDSLDNCHYASLELLGNERKMRWSGLQCLYRGASSCGNAKSS